MIISEKQIMQLISLATSTMHSSYLSVESKIEIREFLDSIYHQQSEELKDTSNFMGEDC